MTDKHQEAEKMAAEAASNERYTKTCIFGEKVFFNPDSEARVPGHIYSGSGMSEYQISKCCEFHFDTMFAEDEEDSMGSEIKPLPGEKTNPMPGQVLMHITGLNEGYGSEGYNERRVTSDINDANVITSLVESELGETMHKPIIDVDLPVKIVPSTTEGHGHLYMDLAMPWEDYVKLLDVLVEIGAVEYGYVSASKERGFTAVRVPWVKKDKKVDA